MNKLGYFSVISGIIVLVGYGIYMMITDLTMPIIVKIPLVLIILGSLIIILSQLNQRRQERSEEDDSSKY